MAEKNIKGLGQWQKKGGGSFTLANGKTIKPGGQFQAYDHEIPKAFRDTVVLIGLAKNFEPKIEDNKKPEPNKTEQASKTKPAVTRKIKRTQKSQTNAKK